jgi:hypothetical protein
MHPEINKTIAQKTSGRKIVKRRWPNFLII